MHLLKTPYGFREVRYLPLSQPCLQLSALLLQRCDLFVFTQLRVCVLRQVSGSLTGKRTLVLLHGARFHRHRGVYLETAGVYIQIIYNTCNQCYELLQRPIRTNTEDTPSDKPANRVLFLDLHFKKKSRCLQYMQE